MKRAGLVSYAVVVSLIALSSIAVAAPSFRATLHAPPAAGSSGPTGTSGPGGETAPDGEIGALGAEMAEAEQPDFAVCEGSTGLDNAICRHEALLALHPDSKGLQHALVRLEENRERHEARQADQNGKGPGEGPAHDRGRGHGHDEGGGGNDG